MTKAYLGLGTNLGDKERNLREAVRNIKECVGNVSSLSAFYATPPWGFQSENTFLNAVACVKTTLTPYELLAMTQRIEREMGRATKSINHAYTDRLIDVDLLMYGEQIINDPNLILPHPSMLDRRFVMEPLTDIAPNAVHPVLKKTIRELFEEGFSKDE